MRGAELARAVGGIGGPYGLDRLAGGGFRRRQVAAPIHALGAHQRQILAKGVAQSGIRQFLGELLGLLQVLVEALKIATRERLLGRRYEFADTRARGKSPPREQRSKKSDHADNPIHMG
jgi:hypothetical protein